MGLAFVIGICLVYVGQSTVVQELFLPQGSNIKDAILQAKLEGLSELAWFFEWLEHTPTDKIPTHKEWFVGIFSQKKALNTLLCANDRVEIYRPLAQSAMQKRAMNTKKAHKN